MALTCGGANHTKWLVVLSALGAAFILNLQALVAVRPYTNQAVSSTLAVDSDSKSTSSIRGDSQIWETPRIVVLAGPHKTGSTSLQKFICSIAGTTYVTGNSTYNASEHFITPHPANAEWSWPVGLYEEYFLEKNLLHAFGPKNRAKRSVHYPYEFNSKFYSTLIPLIVDWNMDLRWPRWMDNKTDIAREAVKADVADYFRNLFRGPWEEGKNIVIGAEAFDFLTIELNGMDVEMGEATHVAPRASEKIQRLLDLFPLNNSIQSQTQLRLEDIEVHINLRSPRFSHLASLWHQKVSQKPEFDGLTLREFVIYVLHWDFNVINSLGLALQFARMGVRTTIVDMLGIVEKDEREATIETTSNGKLTVIGGMEGVLACDILQVGTNRNSSMWCDEQSRLYLPEYKQDEVGVYNHREDPAPRDLTDEQTEEMERALLDYDCSLWQHLRKYEEKGRLRVLYKTKDLFATCDPMGSEDISVFRFTDKLEEIARRENGIPLQEIANPNFHVWYESHQKPFDMVGDCHH